MTAVVLPMFPLGTVLFPHGLLPLHVFEDRYRALVRHCLDGDGQLGIVLIERGSEVGGGDVRFGVGTRARILEALALEDGRWYLVLVGVDRIRVVRWLPEEPFPRAEVEVLADEGDGDASRRDDVEGLLRRALAFKAELGEAAASATGPLDPSPEVSVWQAATMAPLGPADAQRVLEAPGAGERFRLLEEMLREEVAVLAHRVAGG
jgi:ATP-dependent Lon protease